MPEEERAAWLTSLREQNPKLAGQIQRLLEADRGLSADLRRRVRAARLPEDRQKRAIRLSVLSLGGAAGPVQAEVRSAMYPLAQKPHILGYAVGLGGRDVQPEAFEGLVRHAQAEVKRGPSQEFYIYGVRG